MPSTYELIKGETLASSAASYTFTAIPSTYTDLLIRAAVRSDNSGVNEFFDIRINGLTTTIYSDTNLLGDGSAASSARSSNLTVAYAPRYGGNGNTSTANTFSSVEVYIPSYTVSQNKPVGSFGVMEMNQVDTTIAVGANLIRSTAAITSITALPLLGANWLTGSSFYLYGIKNS
jgi:hypothetical protein